MGRSMRELLERGGQNGHILNCQKLLWKLWQPHLMSCVPPICSVPSLLPLSTLPNQIISLFSSFPPPSPLTHLLLFFSWDLHLILNLSIWFDLFSLWLVAEVEVVILEFWCQIHGSRTSSRKWSLGAWSLMWDIGLMFLNSSGISVLSLTSVFFFFFSFFAVHEHEARGRERPAQPPRFVLQDVQAEGCWGESDRGGASFFSPRFVPELRRGSWFRALSEGETCWESPGKRERDFGSLMFLSWVLGRSIWNCKLMPVLEWEVLRKTHPHFSKLQPPLCFTQLANPRRHRMLHTSTITLVKISF